MRLICPNCDAEYEVDGTLIPQAGRDVQCSNCGHAWFQPSPLAEAEAEEEAALFAPGGQVPGASGAADDAPEVEAVAESAPVAATRNIDDSVLAVLREEAERETAQRRAEAGSVETQTEMGLDGALAGATQGAAAMASATADRIARLKGEAEAVVSNASPVPPKREMLPEIDTINSTLRARSERRSGEGSAVMETMPDAGSERASGFRTGFLSVMGLVIVALGLYLLAPILAQKVPALASPLRAYVNLINDARLLIDALLRVVIGWIQGKTG